MTWKVRQRVNFFTEEFRPTRLPVPVRKLLIESGLIVLFLGVVAVGGVVADVYQKHRVGDAEQRLAQLDIAINKEQQRLVVPAVDSRLQQQVNAAEKSVFHATQQLNYLQSSRGMDHRSSQQGGSNRGDFLSLMSQLGEVRLSSVWLSETRLSQRGDHVVLAGLLQTPDAVSSYLDELRKLPSWQGVVFQQLDVNEQGRGYSFRLDTRQRPPEGSAASALRRQGLDASAVMTDGGGYE